MKVVPIQKKLAEEFVTKKHYSRRLGIFWKGFALIEDNKVAGVVCYGQPSPALQKHAFSERDFKFYELTRLVIQSKTKNAASYLISKSLLELGRCAVVSYADSAYGHCGIVYQATNWKYTGSTVSHDKLYLIDGKPTHPMTLRDMGITSPAAWAKENNIESVKPKPKHRYFYFVGSKSDKKFMQSCLRYDIIDNYPKEDKSFYDAGPELIIHYKED